MAGEVSGAAGGAATGAAVGGVPGAIIGGLAGIASSAMGASAAEEAAEMAYKRQKELYQNRHSWTVQDLKNAGLNPALAYGGGGNASGSFPQVAQANSAASWQNAASGFGNLGAVANSAAAVQLDANKNAAEVKVLNNEAHLLEKRAVTEGTTAAQNMANTRLLDEMVPKIRAEISNLDSIQSLRRLETELKQWDLQAAPYTLEAKRYAAREVLASIYSKIAAGHSSESMAQFLQTGIGGQIQNLLQNIGNQVGVRGKITDLFEWMFGTQPDMSVPQIPQNKPYSNHQSGVRSNNQGPRGFNMR